MRAEQQRKSRRRTVLVSAAAAVLVLALIGATALVLLQDKGRKDRLAAAANSPISGVQEYPNLSRNHVVGLVAYPQTPPVGGDHSAIWMSCGVYPAPVKTEEAVHSLELSLIHISEPTRLGMIS